MNPTAIKDVILLLQVVPDDSERVRFVRGWMPSRPARERLTSRSFNGGRFVVLFMILVLIGCQKTQVPELSDRSNATTSENASSANANSHCDTASPSLPFHVTDGLGREITLKGVPKRIVSLAPRITEMLFALNAGDIVVGATSYCLYPPAAERIERVGGFSSKSLSLERIVNLQPDVVLSVGDVHAPIIQELERLQLSVIALTAESFRGLFDELRLLGRITGHEEEAVQLSSKLQDRIDQIKLTAAGIQDDQRLTVYYHVWGDPLTAAGPASHLGEMIQLCGGSNIIDDPTTRYPKISLEVLIARDPAVILSSTNHSDLLSEDILKSKPGWSDIKAVRDKRIHLLDGDIVSRLCPRSVDALELMAFALYPAHFPAPRDDPAKGEGRDRVPQ